MVYLDSLYLVLSNRKRCKKLLNKHNLTEGDIIDTYISLHIILEVSLNALYRQIITHQIIKPISRLEVINNIDKISFIDKTTLFIYNAHFNFKNNLDESAIHHKIIEKLRTFSGIRNKLLHGHSVGSISIDENQPQVTETKKVLDLNNLKRQLRLFIDINNGLRFFLDHLIIEGSRDNYIKDLKKEYLDYSFIPEEFNFKENNR
ncbi:MAG: hypothetical protein AAB441_00965 [Patescibacteria group bacterium]